MPLVTVQSRTNLRTPNIVVRGSSCGVAFHEIMCGELAEALTPNEDTLASSVELNLEAAIENMKEFLVDARRYGLLIGTIKIGKDEYATTGSLELFVVGATPGHRIMRYRLAFTANSVPYILVGTKHISQCSGIRVWRDITTLYVTIWKLEPEPAAFMAGTLSLSLWQGIRLLFSLRGSGGPNPVVRFMAIMRFVGFFLVAALGQALGFPR